MAAEAEAQQWRWRIDPDGSPDVYWLVALTNGSRKIEVVEEKFGGNVSDFIDYLNTLEHDREELVALRGELAAWKDWAARWKAAYGAAGYGPNVTGLAAELNALLAGAANV